MLKNARLFIALLFCASASLVLAQSSIHEDASRHQWYLDAGETSYVIGVNDQGMLQSLYWGPQLKPGAVLPAARMHPERASFDPPIATTPLEYPAWGAGLFTEPALKVDSPNGDRTLVLHFTEAHVEAQRLEIILKDVTQPIAVHLYYQVYPHVCPGSIPSLPQACSSISSPPRNMHESERQTHTRTAPMGACGKNP